MTCMTSRIPCSNSRLLALSKAQQSVSLSSGTHSICKLRSVINAYINETSRLTPRKKVIHGCCTRYRFPPCRTTRTGRYHTCICFHPDMQKGFSFSLSLLYQMRRIRWVKRLWPNKDEGKRAIRSGRIMRFWDVYNRSEQ
jgi:hypothetical protein